MADNQGGLVSSDGFALLSLPMPDRHLMVDIETLDTEITAVILAIGAVAFNPNIPPHEGTSEHEFSCTINKKHQHGRTISDDTVAWWDQQSLEAREAVFGGPHEHLVTALRNFTAWINELRPTCTRIWAKSPDFDCAILRNACEQAGIMWPFKFWETRCVRTVLDMAYPEGDFPHVDIPGAKHDALVDAKVQAVEIQHAYHVLNI